MKKLCICLCTVFFMSIISVYAKSDISAEYSCVMNTVTKSVVYDKNANTRHSMASTTKIMTALVAIEKNTLNDIVTVSRNASIQEGSSIYLRAGDKIYMKDLIYGLMLNSGNDAAVAIAEHISGSVEKFAEEMTNKAMEIGTKNTQFKNPNGLDQEGHYTTAYDLALIASYAIQNETFREIVQTKSTTATLANSNQILYFTNHNKLLKSYPGAIGVKTGYTKATGRCLVSAAERDGMTFVAVTLNAPDDWNDHTKLLDNAFAVYENKYVMRKGEVVKTVDIGGQAVELSICDDVFVPMEKEKPYNIEVSLHIIENLKAPISKGEKVGEADILVKGEKISSTDVICNDDVEQTHSENKGLVYYFLKIMNLWLL